MTIPKSSITAAVIGGIYCAFGITISLTLLPFLEKLSDKSHQPLHFYLAVAVLIFCYPAMIVQHIVFAIFRTHNVLITTALTLPFGMLFYGALAFLISAIASRVFGRKLSTEDKPTFPK